MTHSKYDDHHSSPLSSSHGSRGKEKLDPVDEPTTDSKQITVEQQTTGQKPDEPHDIDQLAAIPAATDGEKQPNDPALQAPIQGDAPIGGTVQVLHI